ncbi:histidinol-phosphate aminotransferase [Cytobacillus eiseniae]|uniref:Histidinol-phosphate aminotransferase n=1 Tax=Cytobacillus eiseniae TaxID=762947 RepID=A0ABS4RHE9_9BACI|nr:histidinol-phosphate transaminase [Cytobacillus eiseniae]MBP2242320.1 histidinol-phosphate aminotransferase [Cytobacillus eiseniae]
MGNIQTRRVIEGIRSYPLGDSPEEIKEKYNLKVVRKMSDNENIYGCSSQVKEAIINNMHNLYLYPDGTTAKLINQLSSYYQLNKDQFLIGNGSEEIIRLLTRAYINDGDEAIMAATTFPRYETNVVIEGGLSIAVPLQNGVHDLLAMYKKITKKTKMIFICNPNNPTGTIVGKEELLRFIQMIPSNILIILDEAYYEYVSSSNYLESISLLNTYSNLVILRTFSKIYGLASLRVGYGMMHSEIVRELQKVKEVFNVNQLAQLAAECALDDKSFIIDCKKKNERERVYVCEQLRELGLGYFPSETNFIYVYTDQLVSEKLITNGLIVRQMKLTGYADAFRITLGTREDNDFFLAVLKRLCNEKVV